MCGSTTMSCVTSRSSNSGLRIAFITSMRFAGRAQWVIRWDFNQDDLDAVRVLDPHLSQPPELGHRLAQDADPSCGQPLVLSASIRHMEPDVGVLAAGGRGGGGMEERQVGGVRP